MCAFQGGIKYQFCHFEYRSYLYRRIDGERLIICFCGLTGVGKTSAIQHCELLGFGKRCYLGGIVLQELSNQGLERTAENERRIQISLRQRYGDSFLIQRARGEISAILDSGKIAFVDAIYGPKDITDLEKAFDQTVISTSYVHSPFEDRCTRLARRKDRPLTASEIKTRDKNEVLNLEISKLIVLDDYHIYNEYGIQYFEDRTEGLPGEY